MQKAVLGLELYDEKIKQKALLTVCGFHGVESISVDMKDKKLTVVGDIDSVIIVKKLRKICHATILTVGPAKEPEKKPDKNPAPEGTTEPDVVYVPAGPPNPNYYCWYCHVFCGRPWCMCPHFNY
ncbi:PREDICTED: uncharacterized protein LOC104811951 [Tarenaya hassleriana]|uniref:uncharacterized protein LOC104811951 n=1 Tax=Tarenaya hassleriana TaxID=28532 RepID=UPI00053CA2BA|nr:PREDICTED: uncharacterized protein LOC104811951 [Tarenaya hassleriana]